MKIISTNIAEQKIVKWRGQKVKTGIYKYPVDQPIYLEKEEVKGDEISDRKHHGGAHKACYLFAAEQYPYWKKLYPDLNWKYGMFGENLTIEGFHEKEIMVGSIYQLGDAIVQITQPREPCYKLGIRFKTQKVLKQFIARGCPGTYVSVLEQGKVSKGDILKLKEESETGVSVWDFFELLYSKDKNKEHIQMLISTDGLPKKKMEKLAAFL
ncbi:MOSC domain-containing protein [Gramella sp. AN32]|uniref:MOSC domain-containing protein n=1 Tax=Christiangramia antarctica TaxID=2058158 RepID=A0ABW5X8K2_9FLAO|nr:MOSC domain-containing protein [Gramella sp. AN32]MCM4155815.1 MOSC domain-containing protein [Gramella sp. AN32]